LTDDLGVSVRYLTPIAAPLFERSGQQSWTALERETLIIEIPKARVALASTFEFVDFARTAILVHCGPVISDLRRRLLLEQEDTPQGALRFPPTMVADEGRRRRAS
jgi:hypothetical protein